MKINLLAGKLADPSKLVNVSKLINAYYSLVPDPMVPMQQVKFGTSGHRGCSFDYSFNEWHILSMTQAICFYRKKQNITGPLFLGIDTHALSAPAFGSALEVLAANNITVMIADNNSVYTPTPVISQAIINYNQGRKTALADGIVITPSHNPPKYGGFKYNQTNGGPAQLEVTKWIEKEANAIMKNQLKDIKRISIEKARSASSTIQYDYLNNYIKDLANVIDMKIIRNSNISIGIDPLGGAGINYWDAIAVHHGLNMEVINKKIDPTFSFMTVDWDGQIRMDPSSPYAMANTILSKDKFDIVLACDTDHDRHGIVTKSSGLLAPNHYLSAAIYYLFQHREMWDKQSAIGKTIVTTKLIDLISEKLNRKCYEVPVGFKWFVDGLFNGSLSFAGEESAGGSFARLNGNVWTTDKDGITLSLLAAEITAKMGRDPGMLYQELTHEFGEPFYERAEAKATTIQKEILLKLMPKMIKSTDLAGEKILSLTTQASGNSAPIGGLKITTLNSWVVIRPSGTEDLYKIYGETFSGAEHLSKMMKEAQKLVEESTNQSNLPFIG
ncbi:MAG: phosphoglucomutase (alpha-D-glucose-1,6-bisphosphate-dependent) [Bacteriovorax sp.]